MKVEDEGLFLYAKNFGESSKILYILSKDNGLVKGLCRYSKNKKNNLINFDKIKFIWSSRNKDSLGFVNVEPQQGNSIDNYLFSIIKASASELCIKFLPLWEKNEEIYNNVLELSNLKKNIEFFLIKKYVSWEIEFLKNLGYQLDINFCSVSGKKGGTFFISPKTGNAVSFDVGEKYSRRLFKIPLCMKENFKKDFYPDYREALQITGFFFLKILENRKQKFIFRDQLISYIRSL